MRKTALGILALILILVTPSPLPAGPARDDRAEWSRLSAMGRGFVAWESNRNGDWRIWRRELDGSNERRISPDEQGQDHIGPSISPDGQWIVYMSQPSGIGYSDPKPEVLSPLRIMKADGSGDRFLVGNARRISGGDRTVLWLDANRLYFLDGAKRPRELDIRTGKPGKPIHQEPGFMVDASRGYAYDRSFIHPFDADSKTVRKTGPKLEGCEPIFTPDSRWSVRMTGAGGPISRIDPSTSTIHPLLKKNDPRMPDGRGYLYFPNVSPCMRLLAFGASPNQHDHFKSDYDIFVAPIDPDTLELTGVPVRYTTDPGTDRYPAVYLAGGSVRKPVAAPKPAPPLWPQGSREPLFEFQAGRQPVVCTENGKSRESAVMVLKGFARPDRFKALEVAKGAVWVEGTGPRLSGAVKATGALTLEVVFRTDDRNQSGPARIVTLSKNTGERNLTLGQQQDNLVLRLRTPLTGVNGTSPEVSLGKVDPEREQHVVITYRAPGELACYINGELVLSRSDAVRGDLSNWEPMEFLFGDEATRDRDWRGRIERVAVHDRAFPENEAKAAFEAWRKLVQARKPAPRFRAETVVTAVSPLPTTAQIAPYREGLVLAEHRVVKAEGPGAPVAGTTLRVAHWGLLDGATPPGAAALKPGAACVLDLEPFEAQPQAQGLFLSDTLEMDLDAPVHFNVTPVR